MYRAVVLVALAACDQVYGLDGRKEPLVDGGGNGGDGSGSNPRPDGSSSSCFFAEPSEGGVAASEWFPDAALTQAVRLNSQGNVEVGRAAGKTVDMLVEANYSPAFVMLPMNYSAMFHPSLSGDGLLLVGSLVHDDQTMHRLGVAMRNGQEFVNPALVDLRAANNGTWTLDVGDTPSGPTTVTPRHMVISNGQRVTEVVQESAIWRASSTISATTLGLGVVSYATLTSDGLGLVLVGTTTANPSAQKVLLATRADIGATFGSPTEIFRPQGVGVASAYLTADCSKLYFVQQGELRWIAR